MREVLMETTTEETAAPYNHGKDLFSDIRGQFGELIGDSLADKLARIHKSLQDAGADAAARRIRRLDESMNKVSVDSLIRLLDPERTVDEFEEACQKNARRWHLWRNVLALIPLVLTWYSLFWATLAYQQELAADPRLVVHPFLDLWQQRFGGHLFPLSPTFAWTAFWDFVLILGIIAATVLAQHLDAQSRRKALALEADLDDAVATVTSALQGARILPQSSPKDWASAVRKVIDDAMAQSKDLAQANQLATRRAIAAIEKAEAGTEQFLSDLTARVGAAIESSRTQHLQIMTSVRDDIDSTLQSAGTAHREIATLNRDAAEAARATLESVRADTQQLIDRLAQEVGQTLVSIRADNASFIHETAKDAISVLTEASSAFRGDMVPLVQQFEGTLRGLDQEMQKYQASAATFAGTVSDLGSAATTLAASSKESATVTQSIDNHLQSSSQAHQAYAAQVAGAAQDMKATSESVQSLAERLSTDVAVRLQDAMNDTRAVSTELRATAGGLHQMLQQLDATTRALHAAADRLGNVQRQRRWGLF